MGNEIGQNTTYPGATSETFIRSIINNIILIKTIAHGAGEWPLFDLAVITPASIPKITN